MTKDPLKIVQIIGQTIYDKKGLNPLAIDIQKVSTLTDYVIVAEGNVDRHVVAIARAITNAMTEEGETLFFQEGIGEGDWVVLDYGNIIIHLFTPGLRQKYQLERLWETGEVVDLQIECKTEGCYG
jgi:ribosome-associated protein